MSWDSGSLELIRGMAIMMENEVNIYDSNINLRPMDAESINPIIGAPFELVEVTSHFEEVKDKCDSRFAKKRKLRHVRAAGIF